MTIGLTILGCIIGWLLVGCLLGILATFLSRDTIDRSELYWATILGPITLLGVFFAIYWTCNESPDAKKVVFDFTRKEQGKTSQDENSKAVS